MSDKDTILEKIKKLLRMKRGGTPAEIETALALAAELARKHGIDLGSVDPDKEPPQLLGHIDATTSARIQWECKYAGLVVQQFFNVNTLLRQTGNVRGMFFRRANTYKLTFIGTRRDIDIAIYIYHFLVRHFRRCWNQRTGRIRNRRAFLYGMYHGLCSKLDEQRRHQVTGQGLIMIDQAVAKRDAYVRENWGDTSSEKCAPDCDAAQAKLQGYLAGRATEIRSGLTPSGTATLAMGN